MGSFQVLPTLSKEDFEGLKASIKKFGVQVPVEYDEHGNIIDGHHRVRICQELGIEDWPKTVRTYSDDDAKRTQARELNLKRRHMGRDVLRALIKEELMENPESSDRHVAQKLGVSHPTVANVRAELENGGKIYHQDNVVGKDGVTQPKKKRAKLPEPAAETEPPAVRKGPPNTWHKVHLPEGETLESVARKALAMEAGGMSPDEVADTLGVNRAGTYRELRDIVALSDRLDLRPADAALTQRALETMRATGRTSEAWELLIPLTTKLWGEGKRGTGRQGTEKFRRNIFDRAFGALVQICSTADQIELPYLTSGQAAEALAELSATEPALKKLKAKLKELTND